MFPKTSDSGWTKSHSGKNRYKKWLNRLPEDSCPRKWERIQESVRTILSTEKETILTAWEKTKFKADFDFDRELENQDVGEEFLLQIRMDELMINYEDEATEEDSENIKEPE